MIKSVVELFTEGKLKQGDAINYQPDFANYNTYCQNTGCKSQWLCTNKRVKWIVLGFDKVNNQVLFMPAKGVNRIVLGGTNGLLRGTEETHNISKILYSSKTLGITARSITIDDVNMVCGNIPPANCAREAFYPKGTMVEGEVEYDGKLYKKVEHCSKFAKFYISDGGGIEVFEGVNQRYRIPKENKPVFVTHTYNYYDISDYNLKVAKMLKGVNLLASTSTFLFFNEAKYRIHYVNSNYVSACDLYSSSGEAKWMSFNLRPVIALGEDFFLEEEKWPIKRWRIVRKKKVTAKIKTTRRGI